MYTELYDMPLGLPDCEWPGAAAYAPPDGQAASAFGPDGRETSARGTGCGMRLFGDRTEFSEAAVAAFKEAAIEPIKNGTFSLDGLERRINVVRTEICQVWNSALPDEEKYRQVSAKENEIALLQAGQFAFAKAGFPLSV
ncbi:hypothetical protein [Pseudodesulfovibrio sp.]|uniref:hypothetical protein n=1 Tax=Pseudodesulfovibrio sp. TaxID=2035812 RepID=UPI00261C5B30|nr:hypothetical protein [Pseudodesulfovibrio sp.]MDD3311714.1 hypothetical protein [Pseudodesulfovibrio sp.]